MFSKQIARMRKLDICEIVTIIVMSAAVIPVIVPLPLPIPISSGTRDFHNELLRIRDGKGVLVWSSVGGSPVSPGAGYLVYPDWTNCLVENMLKLRIKIIFAELNEGSDANWAKLWDQLAPWKQKYGYKYGVDYVILPYQAGGEAAMAAFAANTYVTRVDYYGNDLNTLPLMKNIHTMADCSVGLVGGEVTWMVAWVRQWAEKYGLRLINASSWMAVAPWYGTRFFGYIETYGEIGQAEYETLTGFPGDELIKLQQSDIFAVVFIPAVVVLVIYRRLKQAKPSPVGVAKT